MISPAEAKKKRLVIFPICSLLLFLFSSMLLGCESLAAARKKYFSYKFQFYCLLPKFGRSIQIFRSTRSLLQFIWSYLEDWLDKAVSYCCYSFWYWKDNKPYLSVRNFQRYLN
jgi:hypothetical protein